MGQTIAEIEATGGAILGREISVSFDGVVARPDLYVRTAEGTVMCVEVKYGPTAAFTANQVAAYPAIVAGQAVPVGANAAAANLQVGVTLPATVVKVILY